MLFPRTVAVDAIVLLGLPGIAAAAFWRGFPPGVALTLLGLLIGYVLGPERGFSDSGSALLFALLGASASVAGDLAVRRRRRREAAARVLEQREAHLRSIFDTAPEAMIVINEGGIIQSY